MDVPSPGPATPADVDRLRQQFRLVSELGMRLATTLDPTTLLPTLLTEARRFTRSEAGTLYVREGDQLVFSVAQNDRLEREAGGVGSLPTIRLPIDDSTLAGLAAATAKPLNIEDARTHASHGRATSARLHYEVRSMLVVPMVNHEGAVVGVLQLMNSTDERGQARTYTEEEAYLSSVLASHAATAMGIAGLYNDLHEVFEAIVRYSTAAIDARDPCTAGHSSRVGSYAKQVAHAMGGFTDAELREIRMAGIFHDVGKIGVREKVLTKSDKIDPTGMALVGERFAAASEAAWRHAAAEAAGDSAHGAWAAAADRSRQLADALEFLRRINVPQWLDDDALRRLDLVRADGWSDWEGRRRPLLTDEEHEALAVRRGNLTADERREIETHVELGFKFLKQVPWKSDLARIPELVYCHHEKVNGSGYPRGLTGAELSPQGRILAVCDVFDALTAADRPYKKAIAPGRAVEIIEKEAELGYWDREVVAVLRRLVEAGRFAPHREGADDSPVQARDVW